MKKCMTQLKQLGVSDQYEDEIIQSPVITHEETFDVKLEDHHDFTFDVASTDEQENH